MLHYRIELDMVSGRGHFGNVLSMSQRHPVLISSGFPSFVTLSAMATVVKENLCERVPKFCKIRGVLSLNICQNGCPKPRSVWVFQANHGVIFHSD